MPILTSPTISNITSSTVTIGCTTDASVGTLHAVITTSNSPPSVSQIIAGQDHAGAPAAWSGNQAVSTTGSKTFNVTGLNSSTNYFAHFVHQVFI